MAATLKQIAKWNSQRNPLEHVCGTDSISPSLVARGQIDNAMMILYSPDIKDVTNLREMYRDEK